MNRIIQAIFFLLGPLLLLSCTGSRIAKVNRAIATTRQNIEKENRQLNDLDKKLQSQLQKGNVDSSIFHVLQPQLKEKRKQNETMESTVKELEAFVDHPETFEKDDRLKIKSKIELLNIHNKESKHRTLNYGLIDQTLELAKPSVYGLSLFFGPGQYKVPDAYKMQTREAFRPLLDSISAACNKFQAGKKVIYITVRGYADEQGIQEGSQLYNDLVKQFQLTTPGRQQLNLALSKLRADELGPVIRELLQEKKQVIKKGSEINAVFYHEGYGESLPNSKITDYRSEDERRRIVVVFWNVLPQM
jgi:hypothetical protein